jgi:hypothetical protein
MTVEGVEYFCSRSGGTNELPTYSCESDGTSPTTVTTAPEDGGLLGG